MQEKGEKAAPLNVPFGSRCRVAQDRFDIEMPEGYIRGDLIELDFRFSVDGNAIDIRCNGEGDSLCCGGNGRFGWNTMVSHQYFLPHLATTKTMTLDGTTCEVEGDSWLDRQFQNNTPANLMKLEWVWMDICLDNGDIISLWPNGNGEMEHTWATILKPDGSTGRVIAQAVLACHLECGNAGS